MTKALVWSAVLLGALSSGCGGSANQSTPAPLSGTFPAERKVVLDCTKLNTENLTLDKKPETVIFTTASDCKLPKPAQPFMFTGQTPPMFTYIGGIPDGSIVYYYYDGTPIPAPGYSFSFALTRTNNGTGVIK